MNLKQAEALCQSRIKEQDLHFAAQEWLNIKAQSDERYGWFHHSPNGGKRHISVAIKLKRMGTKRGFPDYVCLVPSNGFQGLAIELKREGGMLSADQKKWLEHFHTIGWRAAVCYSLESFMAVVREYFCEAEK